MIIVIIILFSETYSPLSLDVNLPFADDFQNNADDGLITSAGATLTAGGQPGNGGDPSGSNTTGSAMPGNTIAEREYNRILDDLNQKHKDDEEINAILQDWKLLAQKVDCFLFWVFLCLTTVSSCVFIFILPYYKRGTLL